MSRSKHLRHSAQTVGPQRPHLRHRRAFYYLAHSHIRSTHNEKRHSLQDRRKWRINLTLTGIFLLGLLLWGMLTELQFIP